MSAGGSPGLMLPVGNCRQANPVEARTLAPPAPCVHVARGVLCGRRAFAAQYG